MDTLTLIKQPICRELEAFNAMYRNALQHDNPLLSVALNHLVQRQGKQMRPVLVLLAARYVGEVSPAVLHAAVALEMLHTASLVHDDVVDESDRRRGQKSVNALLDNKTAVLVGDFLLSRALMHAALTGSTQVVECVSRLGQILADGELQQLANTDSDLLSEESYFDVIRKKTASLFACCAHVGALLGGGDVNEIRSLEAFGAALGMCFQMRDDIFDYDEAHDVGKPAGNDMKEGKLTLPVLHVVLTQNDSVQHAVALKVRRGEATQEEITDLVAFTHRFGGIAYACKCMEDYCAQALSLLDAHKETDIVEALTSYVKFVASRKI